MRRLARPRGNDPAIVAGESRGAGPAGLFRAAADVKLRRNAWVGGAGIWRKASCTIVVYPCTTRPGMRSYPGQDVSETTVQP
jgi:hypothetical protein